MGGYRYWRQALMLSVLLHCVLIAGIGFLAPFASTVQPENEYIEMELANNHSATSGELMPYIAKEQLSPSTSEVMEKGSFTGNVQEGIRNVIAIQGDGFNQASASGLAGYNGGSEPVIAGGKQPSGAVQKPVGTESSTIQPPRILQKTDPIYPEQARREGLEGKVIVKLEVLTTGLVGTISIDRSSGYALLDDAAVEAVRQWRFVPAKNTASGLSIRCSTTVPLVFRLH